MPVWATGALRAGHTTCWSDAPSPGPDRLPIPDFTSMNKQALIIGAGPGGLATAILLAAQGLKVKIVERLPIIGGRTSSIEADGYKFDLGPTFFLYPRVLEEIFR